MGARPRTAAPLRAAGASGALLLSLLAPALARAGDTWSTPHPGVRRLLRTTGEPLRIHALVVDLCTPGVGIRATKSGEKGKRTSAFASSVKAEAAVNGDFFNLSNFVTTGLAVGAGQVWPGTKDDGYNAAVAFGEKLAYFSKNTETLSSTPPEGATDLVSGHPQIVKNGAAKTDFECVSHYCSDNPRTAAGMSADRRTLYLVAVDGRSSSSKGVTMAELAKIVKAVGAHDAVNLDGGGSTTMWVKGKGVVNAPSDGAERLVGNHIAVHADGLGKGSAKSCVERPADEIALGLLDLDGGTTTDIDGDGRADACARDEKGFACHPSTGEGFGEPWAIGELSDEAGFGARAAWASLRTGDLDGDGKADVCARGAEGARCWRSTGEGFGPAVEGPAWTDAAGFGEPGRYATLRMIDVTGDGADELCAREAEGIRCYPFLAGEAGSEKFGEAIAGPAWEDADGWGEPPRFGTIRAGDVDGDGRIDLCAREASGLACWLARPGEAWKRAEGPAWSDAEGWGAFSRWSTIRLADVDGDGRADACARGSDGIVCHLSTGEGFGEAFSGPALADAEGWADQANFLTIRLADVDGDGKADLCARADDGVRCYPSTGKAFGEAQLGPALADEKHWYAHRRFRTIRLADIDGDGKADLCARRGSGLACWPALPSAAAGSAFGEAIDGPVWSDELGWDAEARHGSVRIAGPRRAKQGGAGAGPAGGGAGGAGAEGAEGEPGASPDGGLTGGCACRLPGGGPSRAGAAGPIPFGGIAGIAGIAAALGARRRTRRTSSPALSPASRSASRIASASERSGR